MNKNQRLALVLFCIALALCLAAAGVLLFPQFMPEDTATLSSQTATAEITTRDTTGETTQETTEETTAALREFGYQGAYLTCLTEKSVLGIDVSSFQKDIDWKKVASAGVEFVMIRVGFRGYGQTGGLNEDKYAQQNYLGAKAAGLKVGAYFFSQAISVEEAEEEAQYVLELTQDWQMDMPIGFDWECHTEEYRTAGVDARLLTDCTKAFCGTMAAKGKDVVIYVNPTDSPKQMYWEEVTGFGLWLGQYGEALDYPLPVVMWQYTNTGKVPGISGNADINLYFQEGV